MVKTNDLKKGTEIMSVQLGLPVKGVIADNKKGNTRLVDVKGSSIGMFDEILLKLGLMVIGYQYSTLKNK